MTMTSASLDIWKDTGYTEGCLEVPKTSSTLSDPDYSFDGLEISTSSLFSEVKVKGEFAALFECSYLRMTYSMNNGDDVTVFGWIDSVAVGSDSAGSPMTRISWHVDLWRSYISKVTLGSGIVKRRTATGDIPIQPYGNRYTLTKTPRDILPTLNNRAGNRVAWVYINYTADVNIYPNTVKGISTLCYPVQCEDLSGGQEYGYDSESNQVWFPSWENTILGGFDEVFGLDPDAIYGAFISPVPPSSAALGTLNGWTMTNWKIVTLKEDSGVKAGAFFWNRTDENPYAEQSFTTMAETTDITSYVITDLDRAPIGVLPWGISVNGGKYRTINADTAMYISIRFTSSLYTDGLQSANGMEFAIPLKTIAVSTNAKSTYLYSGQQELDREQMTIQREQALQSGIANIGNSTVQGAMGGAMLGAIAGPVGIAGGAAIGAISSAVGGTISTISDYYITGAANDKMMDATIRQKAQQTSYMTLPSAGQDWVYYGHSPQLIPLQWDDYSITQRSTDMQLYGAHVDEPRTSCQSLLTAGGPLQIANCTVLGSVPVQAKRYIKERLSNGVRIV